MRIAVTYENGNVFQHFGRSEFFKIYDMEGEQIKSSAVISTEGNGHGALADFLKSKSVDKLICGGIGGGARQALAAAGIEFFGGVSGSADQAAADLAAGKLNYNPDVACSHHGGHHHGGHSCGSHDA